MDGKNKGLEENSVVLAAEKAKKAAKELNRRRKRKRYNGRNPIHWTEDKEAVNDDVELTDKEKLSSDADISIDNGKVLEAIRAIMEGGE